MITYSDALAFLLSHSIDLKEESIFIEEATGRIAAQDVFSDFCIPHFNNSAMDGYAIKSSDTVDATDENPISLYNSGIVEAGACGKFYGDLSALKIMTGACIPEGYDAVIPIEQVDDTSTPNRVMISRFVNTFENVRHKGEDYQKGEKILEKGTRVAPQHIMALAACGIQKLTVFKKIKIGVISTGKELKNVSEKLDPHCIYNSNTPYLISFLQSLGCSVADLGIVPDDTNAFIKTLKVQLEKGTVDCFVTTGAVSMGVYDFIPSAIQSISGEIIFHKVAIRPGKPILFAKLGNVPFFGLPGNPISVAVGCSFFIEPFLKHIWNEIGNKNESVCAELISPFRKTHNLRQFLKASYHVDPQTCCLKVNICDGQESFKIKPFSKSNCWVALDENKKEYNSGDKVWIKVF